MLIMTQSKDKIINFNDFSVIYHVISDNKYCIYVGKCGIDECEDLCLGSYNSMKDVIDVMDLLFLSYCYTPTGKLNFAFKMPQEEQISKSIQVLRKLEGTL